MGPGYHVLDGGVQIPMGSGNFERWKECPIVKYRDTLQSSVRKRLNRLRCRLGCGLRWAQGIMCYMGVQRCWATLPWQPLLQRTNRNAHIANAVLATAIPSVRLTVCLSVW